MFTFGQISSQLCATGEIELGQFSELVVMVRSRYCLAKHLWHAKVLEFISPQMCVQG